MPRLGGVASSLRRRVRGVVGDVIGSPSSTCRTRRTRGLAAGPPRRGRPGRARRGPGMDPCQSVLAALWCLSTYSTSACRRMSDTVSRRLAAMRCIPQLVVDSDGVLRGLLRRFLPDALGHVLTVAAACALPQPWRCSVHSLTVLPTLPTEAATRRGPSTPRPSIAIKARPERFTRVVRLGWRR